MLKIFNTLTKKKEIFKPIHAGNIKLYVCGVTAYDLCHLGHGRIFVIFDVIVRYLLYCGYRVEYVRNITDIDDKIINRARINDKTIYQFTKHMIQEMNLDLDKLNILRPTYEPKVTEYIDTIIQLICLLIKKNHAYINSNGDVMFSVKTVNNYGILSRRKSSKVHIKTNDSYNENIMKQNSKDFVLWKSSKSDEPSWESPWGQGRPGWHIECSAMSNAILGKEIDIHGGGSDLIFPHHDNEIAQSTCAYNTFYVKTWIHCGMLSLNNEKMSKSLKNFFTIRESLQNYDAETIRFFLLSAHYRNQLQYNDNSFKNARASLKRLYFALRDIEPVLLPNSTGDYFVKKFSEKMNDDFNTPEACSVLFEIAHELNILKQNKHYVLAQEMAGILKYLANILGILYLHPENYLKLSPSIYHTVCNNDEKIQTLIQVRENARVNNQWELADKIRKQLQVRGIILEDSPKTGRTKWRYIF